MPERSLDQTMDALAEYLDDFDQITREAHDRYMRYDALDLVEHDRRAQAACTYSHMVAAASRKFDLKANVNTVEIRHLKLWILDGPNVAIRFKKMDENGSVRRYPTKQAEDFDAGNELPNLPMPPVRLTVGYLLNTAGTDIERSQVSRPSAKTTVWCAAIVPSALREEGEASWYDVNSQARFA